jgi:hypothetical protein
VSEGILQVVFGDVTSGDWVVQKGTEELVDNTLIKFSPNKDTMKAHIIINL